MSQPNISSENCFIWCVLQNATPVFYTIPYLRYHICCSVYFGGGERGVEKVYDLYTCTNVVPYTIIQVVNINYRHYVKINTSTFCQHFL